jgi:molybdopterin/thiamine biosynthesis adenylyltransferase/proteasome lid subunit RPN8/RPN11
MQYTLTMLESHYADLVRLLMTDRTREHAAYLMCRVSRSDSDVRLLVREVHPLRNEEILSASPIHMKITASSFMRELKRADQTKQVFLFVHSHPNGPDRHSEQDDLEEKKLFSTAYIRIDNPGPHGSLVMSADGSIKGRVWMRSGECLQIETIRIIGNRFRFHHNNETVPDEHFFQRQVLAFGNPLQSVLKNLNVGLVGVGGTGSSVVEQLIRLGVGRITVFDGDRLDESNVSRVYGSGTLDRGEYKTSVAKNLAQRIGLNTRLVTVSEFITFESVARKLRECDVLFGCTDDEWGRSILTRMAVYYYIPVFDMGVRIDSINGNLRSVQGRVTTLLPGGACLFCRGRLRAENIAAEVVETTNPEAAAKLRGEGYIPELPTRAPAVVSFTTAVAASAVTEFLHRLTGFLGTERASTEVLHLFDQTRVRTNNVAPDPACFCTDHALLGRGDSSPLLDITWREEQ